MGLYEVEEFVDEQDGSINLKVMDVTATSGADKITNYYRIKERGGINLTDDGIVSYCRANLICKQSRTIDWDLKEYTRLLDMLIKSESINTGSIENDRTAIGPLALLRIVKENLESFIYSQKAIDDLTLTEMYYFRLSASPIQDHILELVIMIPVFNVPLNDKPVEGKTSLASLRADVYPAKLALVLLGKDAQQLAKRNPQDLLGMEDSLLKIVISYHSINQRMTSLHLGVNSDILDETDPFSLPSGAGCGSASKHNQLNVPARQFSGIYRSLDVSSDEYFIAFDSETNHLRLDSIGHHKLIYNLKEKRAIFMTDPTSEFDPSERNFMKVDIADKSHCAQAHLIDRNDEDGFSQIRRMEDVLGLDAYVEIFYLGTRTLEDGTQCLLYEREISPSQIPLIVKLNTRVRVRPNSRLFIAYYFTDELGVESLDQLPENIAYKSLWLKRVELTSLSSVSKYKILNSQVNFDEFAWSLESMAGDPSDRESISMHPVRTFDIDECKSTHSKIQLELLIEQATESQWSERKLTRAGSRIVEFVDQVESFEEAVMVFLSGRTRIARSQIDQLEVTLPDSDKLEFVLIRAQLVEHLDFYFERKLVGWVDSVKEIPAEELGGLDESVRTRHECALKLAVKFIDKNQISLVFCPNHGCSLLNELSFKFKKADGPSKVSSLQDKSDMCEIYTQTREVDSENIVTTKFQTSVIDSILYHAKFSIDLQHLTRQKLGLQQVESSTFKGIVSKVVLTKGLSSDSLGSSISSNFCFTMKTSVSEAQNLEVRIAELELDKHHSLVHCHKACHLYHGCTTYSYHKRNKTCTLTNIPRQYITDHSNQANTTRLSELKDDVDCNIYQLNAIHLYKSTAVATSASLAGLSEREFQFSKGSLADCANVCHQNEFADLHCSGFIYFRLISICAIQDEELYKSKLKNRTTSDPNNTGSAKARSFKNLVGAMEWNAYHQSHQYNRDYVQYFEIVPWTSIDLKEPQDFANGSQLAKLPPIYKLSYEECLRECIDINKGCLMLDYCFQPINWVLTQLCIMYNIRSPLLVGKQTLDSSNEGQGSVLQPPLTDLEKPFYQKGASDNHSVTTIASGCNHHYLSGDNLMLKMDLARSLSWSLNSIDDKSLERVAREDQARSEDFRDQMGKIASNGQGKDTFNSTNAMVMTLFLLTGTLIGFMAFHSSTLLHCIRFQVLERVVLRRFREARSSSATEFNELEYIYPDD